MRKILPPWFVTTVALFFLSHTERSKKDFIPEASGRWSGTLTMVEKMVWNEGCLSSSSERHVRMDFTNALPTLFRDDGETDFSAYTDNKGTGSSIYHSEANVCGQKSKSDCTGNGDAELHNVTIRPWDKTYDIEAFAPPCIGTNSDGSPYGPDIMGVTVSNEPLTNEDHLQGSKTVTAQVAGTTATVTKTFTWDLVREKEPIDLIVTPVDYDTWLPTPGVDENHQGNTMTINLKLQGRNGKPLTKKAARFELQLIQTSAEPGLMINYPLQPEPTRPDIRFIVHQNATLADDFQVISIDCNGCTTATAKIGAYDGGGYTTLIATAVLQDSTRVRGTLKAPGGIVEIPIPKRKGSIIGEYWLSQHGNPGDYDDKEKSKNNYNDGDGLTAYEEYRGVMAEGSFKRLEPQKKELGISMPRSLFSTFNSGISWFEAASDIKVVRFYVHEIAANRRLNKNYSTGHVYDQYALYLIAGALPSMVGGKAYTTTDNPEIPARTTRVVIDLNQMPAIYQALVANESPLPVPYTQVEILASTIAHEIAHGVNVAHHADIPDLPSPITVDNNTSPIHHIYDTRGNEIRTRPFIIHGIIGAIGNQESGDLECVMAYNPYCSWAFQTGLNGTHIYRRVPPMVIGRKLCKSGDGTGINTPPGGNAINKYFGNAPVGNCLLQLKLKD